MAKPGYNRKRNTSKVDGLLEELLPHQNHPEKLLPVTLPKQLLYPSF